MQNASTPPSKKIEKSMWAGPTQENKKINLAQIRKKITYTYEGDQVPD